MGLVKPVNIPESSVVLNKDRIDFLLWLLVQEEPPSKQTISEANAPGYSDSRIEQLRVEGLITRGLDVENGTTVGVYSVSDKGQAALEFIARDTRKARWENIRYAITTLIAVAALVISIFF